MDALIFGLIFGDAVPFPTVSDEGGVKVGIWSICSFIEDEDDEILSALEPGIMRS